MLCGAYKQPINICLRQAAFQDTGSVIGASSYRLETIFDNYRSSKIGGSPLRSYPFITNKKDNPFKIMQERV